MNQGKDNHQNNRYLPMFTALGVAVGTAFGCGLDVAFKNPWALPIGMIAGICLSILAWGIKIKLSKR